MRGGLRLRLIRKCATANQAATRHQFVRLGMNADFNRYRARFVSVELERRQEIGLMKALGAGQFALSAIFVTEAVLLACAGGLVGFAGGALLRENSDKQFSGPQSLWNRCCCR